MADTDLDLVTDASDNCPAIFNYDQGDLDGDGTGNLCDHDFATHSTKLPDLNGNGRPEIAVMRGAEDGSWPVQVFDTDTGERLARFPAFGKFWTGRALAHLKYEGRSELVALGVKRNGTARVAFFDAATGRERERFDVLDPRWSVIDLAVVPKLSAAGRPAVAVLGQKPNGTIVAEVWRADERQRLRKTRFFDAEWTPRAMLAINDIDGDGGHELAVLAEHPDGRIATLIKTARGGFKLRKDLYFDESWRFRDFADLGDANGRGDDELAVLAQRRDGRHSVVVRNAGSGRELAAVSFPGNGWSALAVRGLPDVDGSGNRELAVLMQRDNGRIRIQTRDSIAGTQVGIVKYFTGAWSPQSLLVLPAPSRRDGPDLALVATRGADGRTKLEARDALSGDQAVRFPVP